MEVRDFLISTGRWLIRFGMLCAFVIFFSAEAHAEKGGDSTSRATLVINPRMHSGGYFPFTGALLNHNPVADVNVFYSRRTWGFFLFQSVDLADGHSYANYMQPGIFATVNAQPNLRIRAFFGYIFSQTTGFRDADSDYYTAVQANWGITSKLRLENTLLFYDYSMSKKLANRLLLEWSERKFRFSVYVWQRTVLDEKFNSTSGAVAITFPIIKLGKKASVELTSSYMGYLSKEKPSFALQDGAIFTLAVPLNLND